MRSTCAPTTTGVRVSRTDVWALKDFDAVVMRTDPPVDTDYLLATQLLGIAEANGARVLNRPAALRDFNEKLAILNFPAFVAPTLVSADAAEIGSFLAEHGDIIVKPLTEMGGSGIFRLTLSDPNRNAILETLTRHGRRAIMAQRYLPAISEGDKRILLIDGEVVPWALARIPQAGETRGNLAAGGTARAQPLTRTRPRDRRGHRAVGARSRHLPRRPRRHRRLPHRNQRHQPHRLSGNHGADRARRGGAIHRRSRACLFSRGSRMRSARHGLWLLLLWALAACSPPPLHQQQAYVFGTLVDVSIYGAPEPQARQAAAAVLARFDALHRMLHAWQPSELSRLNAALARGERTTVTPELAAMLRDAQTRSIQSNDLFNPAIGGLIALWGFHSDAPQARVPDAAAIAAWVDRRPRMADLHIENDTVWSSNPAVQLDLGGYAKGRALDDAVAILKSHGIAERAGEHRRQRDRAGRARRPPVARGHPAPAPAGDAGDAGFARRRGGRHLRATTSAISR